MKTPNRTTATAFPRYSNGSVLADSASLKWPGLYVRHFRFPRIVDRFLVPATPEPLISCVIRGTAELHEREIGEAWVTRHLKRGNIFITRSKTPYELRCQSPIGEEIDFITIHIAVDLFLSAMETAHPDKSIHWEVVDFFGRDEALEHLCFMCAEMLFARTPGSAKRVAILSQLFAAYLIEKYTDTTPEKPASRGGLPIHQLRKVEDYVRDHRADEIPIEVLAGLVELSTFHFSRVFKQATGLSPLQYITRERISSAQQLLRETSRSIIDIALEAGYTSPSHFAQVFHRVVGVTPTDFRNTL